MKKIMMFLSLWAIGTAVLSQGTPRQQRNLQHDLIKEREKRHEVAKDILKGEPNKARADHEQAMAYHRNIHRDVHRMHAYDHARIQEHHPLRYHRRRHHQYPAPPRP